MHYKYCSHLHPIDYKLRQGTSTVWKRMLEARKKTGPHIIWLVGKGDIVAFKDKWCLANLPRANYFQKVKQFFHPNDQPNFNLLISRFSEEILGEIDTRHITLNNFEDR